MLQKIYLPTLIAIFLIIFAYLATMTYKFLNQSKYVYFPTEYIGFSPKDIGLRYEDIYFFASDGTRINGWYIPSGKEYTLLIFHGNGGNISDRIGLIKIFNKIGLSIFIIDYRGYGKSSGEPSEEGTYLDASGAWDYLVKKKKVNPKKIIVYGRSLGGPIAAKVAKESKPAALVLDSTFTSIKDIGAELYPYLPVNKFFKYDYNTINYLKHVNCPVMVIHSREDDYIPFEHGQKVYDSIQGRKELVVIKGSHNDNIFVSEDIYMEKIDSFLHFIDKASGKK